MGKKKLDRRNNQCQGVTLKRILLVLPIVALLGCLPFSFPELSEQSYGCPPLPSTFKESDLVGTWVAKYNGDVAVDTLILREDGTYKQIYKESPPSYYGFESSWQKWWIEQRSSGLLRLHMEGMGWCAGGVPSLCQKEGGGIDDLSAFDYCEGKGIKESEGELVLIVTGVTERNVSSTPRGIWIRHPRYVDPDAPTYHFELQK